MNENRTSSGGAALDVLADMKVAVVVPCFNEEAAIAKVVHDLRAALPTSTIYVYDNNSTDATAAEARSAGAVVRREPRRGKGNVVRRAFSDIDADVYLLIDGDDTYDASAAPAMVELLLSQSLDHVLGVRQTAGPSESAYRPGHEQGNRAFNRLVSTLFGEQVSDMLSGYRVFSRRFVKSFPALSREFEIETELTVHCMHLRLPQAEYPVAFRDRPAGSASKLRTYHDGFRILRMIVQLLQHERPLFFYGLLAALAGAVSLVFGIPLLVEFAATGLVPRIPTAIVASSLMVISMMSLVVGLVLNGVLRGRKEAMRLVYLGLSGPDEVFSRGHAA